MNKSIKALLLFSIILTVCVGVLGLRTPNAVAHQSAQSDAVDENQFPIAEESAPEPSTPAERTKRKNKEKKYGKYKNTIGPGVTVASVHFHWPPAFPTLPVRESDAVIIAEVTGARAQLTEDKLAVYSEFNVRVVKVLKDDKQMPLIPGVSIVAERPGGRVRYSSGHISRFSLTGFGMPQVTRKYVLFLNRNLQEGTYHLVTGYELGNGRISPLDKTTSSDTDFDAYINMDEAAFFQQLDAAIALSSSAGQQ